MTSLWVGQTSPVDAALDLACGEWQIKTAASMQSVHLQMIEIQRWVDDQINADWIITEWRQSTKTKISLMQIDCIISRTAPRAPPVNIETPRRHAINIQLLKEVMLTFKNKLMLIPSFIYMQILFRSPLPRSQSDLGEDVLSDCCVFRIWWATGIHLRVCVWFYVHDDW